MAEDIRNGEYESKQPDDVDIEWENDPEIIVEKETIMKRKYVNFNTKEEIFLWRYETIFNWLGIKLSTYHKEQFWEAVLHNVSNNRKNQYEIGLREIMEYEIRGGIFKWWDENTRKA
jgi:hypothetical protein